MIEHESEGHTTLPLARALGSKTGLCSSVRYQLSPRHDPIGGVLAKATQADLDSLIPDREDVGSVKAIGKGGSIRQGVSALLGETVERYAFDIVSPPPVEASYDELAASHEMVDSKYFTYYSEESRERATEAFGTLGVLDESEPRPWIAGTNLLTGEKTYVPYELIVVDPNSDADPLLPTTSNGLACHETLPRALLASLYEQVERDAFMEAWFTRTTPTRIRLDDFEIRTENDRVRLDLFAYETGVDLPTTGCLSRSTVRKPPYALIAGDAGPTYRDAIRSTCWEASQGWQTLTRRDSLSAEGIDPRLIANLTDNADYYFQPENFGPLEFLLEGEEMSFDEIETSRSFEEPSEELAFVLDRLEAEGVTPIGVELTTPDVESTGLHVTKVVVPELLQLSLPSFPFDSHPKLEGRIETDHPHPYP